MCRRSVNNQACGYVCNGVGRKGASQEWLDATLIPIPKKGYLVKCDNWVGIALLDVVGKV